MRFCGAGFRLGAVFRNGFRFGIEPIFRAGTGADLAAAGFDFRTAAGLRSKIFAGATRFADPVNLRLSAASAGVGWTAVAIAIQVSAAVIDRVREGKMRRIAGINDGSAPLRRTLNLFKVTEN